MATKLIDIKMSLPIYESKLGLDNTLRQNIYTFLDTFQDEMEHKTNVKATMTNYYVHKSNQDIGKLSEIVLKIVQDFTNNPELHTFNCWGAVYTKNQSTVPHCHSPSLYSWCYYVKVPDDSSPLIFTDTNIRFVPHEDELIIFPSFLNHSVPPNLSEHKRIMVAGNINKKYLYKEEEIYGSEYKKETVLL